MKRVSEIEGLNVYLLDKSLAEKYKEDITPIWNLIPLSNHLPDDILEESSGSRQYYGKWSHSLIVIEPSTDRVIAFIVGYEREAEENNEYPKDSLHLKSLSVDSNYQNRGIGKKLVKLWLDFNRKQGFLHLSGNIVFSTQTNSADWNNYVQKFYESFGFEKTATKSYDNKVDNVYFLE